MPLLRRLRIELDRAVRVLLHPFSVFHQPAQTALSVRIPCLSRTAVPLYGLLGGDLRPDAKLIVPGQLRLAGGVPLKGGGPQPFQGSLLVLGQSQPLFQTAGQQPLPREEPCSAACRNSSTAFFWSEVVPIPCS